MEIIDLTTLLKSGKGTKLSNCVLNMREIRREKEAGGGNGVRGELYNEDEYHTRKGDIRKSKGQ